MGFFENMYYGNTPIEWAIALGIILGAFLAGKIIYMIIGATVKKLTAKTKNTLDDILVDKVEEPIMLAIILGGMWYATTTLTLSAGAQAFFGKVFWGLLILNVGWFVARFVEALLQEYVKPLTAKSKSDFDDQLFPIFQRGSKIIIWVLAIILALDNAGFDITAVIAGLGIGGLALAMAAKDLVANIFGGIMVFLDKPFKIKERIKIDGFDGTVTEIGLRSTRMKTLAGTEVTIPNSTFTSNPVENVSREPTRKIVLDLGLVYDTSAKDLEKAMAILEKIAKKQSKLITDDYKIAFTAFGDFSLGIKYIYYIKKSADILGTQNAMNLDILTEFNKANLSMAFPTQTIELKKEP